MKRNRWSVLPVLLVCSASVSVVVAGFDEDFTGATLRVDYYHMGTTGEERFALDRARVEGPWPGSRTQLIDASNLVGRKQDRQHSGLINGYGVAYPELKEVVRACANEMYDIAGRKTSSF